MSEEKTQTEAEVQVPLLSITEEDLEKNKKSLEDAKAILTPPEGQVLAGLRSFCPVHGDITRASKILKHTIYMKNEKTGEVEPVSYTDVVCLACLSKLWREGVVAKYPKDPDGTPGEIKIAPVFISKEEYEALLKKQKEEAIANQQGAAAAGEEAVKAATEPVAEKPAE